MVQKGKCPICGADNGCAMLSGEDPKSCWCMTIKVPKALLETIKEEDRNQSCVCKKCILEYKEKNQ